jgi:hypothetical protein
MEVEMEYMLFDLIQCILQFCTVANRAVPRTRTRDWAEVSEIRRRY